MLNRDVLASTATLYQAIYDIGTNYYKEYHYKGVKFYSLVDKEEYEDATF